jgi:hypothetical protein
VSQEQLTFQLSVPPAEILTQIRNLAQKYGGQWHGDEHSGQVSFQTPIGLIESDYTLNGDTLTLTITKKPFLVGYDLIRKTIQENATGLA